MTYSPFLHCLLMRGPGHTLVPSHAFEEEKEGQKLETELLTAEKSLLSYLLNIILGSGCVGVRHIFETWSPPTVPDIASAASNTSQAHNVHLEALLLAHWLPSIHSPPVTAYPRQKKRRTSVNKDKARDAAYHFMEGTTTSSGIRDSSAIYCDITPFSLAGFLGDNVSLRRFLEYIALHPLGTLLDNKQRDSDITSAYASAAGAFANNVHDSAEEIEGAFDTHGEKGAYTHRLSAAVCNRLAISPIVACTLSCNHAGLSLLKLSMGTTAFARACNQPDGSGMIASVSLLQLLAMRRRSIALRRAAAGVEGPYSQANLHSTVKQYFYRMHAASSAHAAMQNESTLGDLSSGSSNLSYSRSGSSTYNSIEESDLSTSLRSLDASFTAEATSGFSSSEFTSMGRHIRGYPQPPIGQYVGCSRLTVVVYAATEGSHQDAGDIVEVRQ